MEDKILYLIKQRVGEDVSVTNDSEFFNDLGLSSLDMAIIILTLEDELGLKINVMDLVGIKTVGSLIERIKKNT